MAAKPIKSLELYYTMIQFLIKYIIINIIFWQHTDLRWAIYIHLMKHFHSHKDLLWEVLWVKIEKLQVH